LNWELSVILPAYNASGILQAELAGLQAFLANEGIKTQIIVVDDGSSDAATSEIICRKHGIEYHSQIPNKGKGAALRLGFLLAKAPVIIFTDCDVPFQYHNITNAYRLLYYKQTEIVTGDRTLPESVYYPAMPVIRNLGSYLIAGLAKRLLRYNLADTQCGLKGFSRAAAATIMPKTVTNRFGIDFEILLLASGFGYRLKKIPVQLRVKYPSTLNIWKDGIFTIIEIIKAIWLHGSSKKRR
jgi:dolichyl-phosphate beta-glucosyltransferase